MATRIRLQSGGKSKNFLETLNYKHSSVALSKKHVLWPWISTTGWLLYGGPEKTKDCVKVVSPINKVPYQILDCISLATQKHPDLLCSASHRHESDSIRDTPIFSKIMSEIPKFYIS